MTSALPYVFAIYPLCLVAVALTWLLGAKPQSWLRCAILSAACGSIIVFAFLAGSWAFTSYYLRYTALVLLALSITFICRRIKIKAAADKECSAPYFSALVLLLFTVLNGLTIAAHHQPDDPLDLSFPLTAGNYYVLQGGNSIVTNPFHSLSGNRLALDIVKLNRFGNRADRIAPTELTGYEIFGERLYSPCTGSVLSVRDGLPDNSPGRPDLEHHEGNYIILKCGDAEVFLAHLQCGSISVAVGEAVNIGQLIGRIGNSGNTLEPHLHISATKSGTENGIRFNGRSLTVNSVVISNAEVTSEAGTDQTRQASHPLYGQ